AVERGDAALDARAGAELDARAAVLANDALARDREVARDEASARVALDAEVLEHRARRAHGVHAVAPPAPDGAIAHGDVGAGGDARLDDLDGVERSRGAAELEPVEVDGDASRAHGDAALARLTDERAGEVVGPAHRDGEGE